MDKLHSYQGWTGRVHEWRDGVKTKYSTWRDSHPGSSGLELVKNAVQHDNNRRNIENVNDDDDDDYSHIYRKKTRKELIRVSLSVMGIEFSYAAETAFVSPTLLKIGVEHKHMTLVWGLSPLIGFCLTPILGSLSDRCRLQMGRRRPFIILLSIGVFLGLLLVPNGEDIGYALGDFNPYIPYQNLTNISSTLSGDLPHRSTASQQTLKTNEEKIKLNSHPWGVFFTILGTVLLDFDADACQSPARAYLLDVTVPDDHAKGLSTFTVMAGLGGFMGYSLGGINWDVTAIGMLLGGSVRAVFTLITFIFITCVLYTITSFKEIPLKVLEGQSIRPPDFLREQSDLDEKIQKQNEKISSSENNLIAEKPTNDSGSYGALDEHTEDEIPKAFQKRRYTMPPLPMSSHEYTSLPGSNIAETSFTDNKHHVIPHPPEENTASLSHYLISIVFMPHSLRMVCLTNLFCWMAHVCYSLYFTDFVGEAVFGGDPKALPGDIQRTLYEEGVRFGCWGMAMYSLSCACYSFIIEKLIKRFRAKRVYIGGLLIYCIGMTLMALTKNRVGVILFSWTAGVMYSTLFTMPYLLVAHYHAQGTFELDNNGEVKLETEVRGLGTDIAIVSSMVFLAQFILSICMGTIVSISGTTTAVVSIASFLSFCGAISATQIMYLDL